MALSILTSREISGAQCSAAAESRLAWPFKLENDMPRIELLDNNAHKDLQVVPHYSASLGDNLASTVTFITEFAEVQKEFPILFRKAPENDEYQAVVLFGIQQDENLFLVDSDPTWQAHLGWSAAYVPAVVARGPFSIGLQKQQEQGEDRLVPLIHVDMAHPKATAEGGVNVFLEQGGNSPYLEHISNKLNLIRDGMQLNKPMFSAFVNYGLIEDVSIDIDLENGDKFRIGNFQTINADKLQALSGNALEELNRAGFLQAAYFVVASLANIQKLINKKNRLLRSAPNEVARA